MAAIKAVDTVPELLARRLLHRQGFRFRLHVRELSGKPDIVFPRYRMVVFVNGCFWHGHGCARDHLPRTNRPYWRAKVKSNVDRDAENITQLRRQNWRIAILWECSARIDTMRLIRRLRRLARPQRKRRATHGENKGHD
jgi:DNA mismatch endonuclease (patch repair protein)